MDFKKQYTFQERLNESGRIIGKFPDRVPVICEQSTVNSRLPLIGKKKFLVPVSITVSQLVCILRKRVTIPPEMGIFLYVNSQTKGSHIPPNSLTISEIYKLHRDEDNFLYVSISSESTFGSRFFEQGKDK